MLICICNIWSAWPVPFPAGGKVPHFLSASRGSSTTTTPSFSPNANWFRSDGCAAITSGCTLELELAGTSYFIFYPPLTPLLCLIKAHPLSCVIISYLSKLDWSHIHFNICIFMVFTLWIFSDLKANIYSQANIYSHTTLLVSQQICKISIADSRQTFQSFLQSSSYRECYTRKLTPKILKLTSLFHQ